MKAILHTKDLINRKNTTIEEKEVWNKVYEIMDGEKAIVHPSRDGKYALFALINDIKDKELFWQIEQDNVIGTYKNREEFEHDWAIGKYEMPDCLYLEKNNVELLN